MQKEKESHNTDRLQKKVLLFTIGFSRDSQRRILYMKGKSHWIRIKTKIPYSKLKL